ncbi:MAG: hypothetical protein DWQ39_08420 [Bacteroidetes bacterium]|nr:MAG: hypothetical protein DWQ33_09410 [Bacteroidota bacterium]REK05206.1 MAG: hypothetical protein DWQ39_08420 [Bacteroidota bacterium]REK48942.1 MAG: hypothetical protein DWQ48_08670 [Bacteroidota bacterium]
MNSPKSPVITDILQEFDISKALLPYDAFLRVLRENTDTGHVFLLGAGASISSGIQSAADCIWEWKRNIFITQNPNLSKEYSEYKSDSVRRSIQKWLDAEGCYPLENSTEEYSYYALKTFPIDDTRRKYFENICKGKEPFIGYKILALLAKYGMVRSVFSTNFDGLVEKSAHQMGLTPIAISLDTAERIHRPVNNQELMSVALHGDFKYGPLKNTSTELDTQHETFVEAIERHLYDKHLIVCGYSGRDISLMKALKKAYAKPGGGMLFWCGYGDDPSPQVQELLNSLSQSGRHGYYIGTDGFDQLMTDTWKTCFTDHEEFSSAVEKLLKGNTTDEWIKTPFTIDSSTTHALLRSNLVPISLPSEVYQMEFSFEPEEKAWATLRELTKDKAVVAAPIKKMVFAFGTQGAIREAFGSRIKDAIKRTPITYEEIKNSTALHHLYIRTVIKALSLKLNLGSDFKKLLWLPNSRRTVTHENIAYELFDAVEMTLSFDNNIYRTPPFAYVSFKPTFYLQSTDEKPVPKRAKFDIGKKYHEDTLGQRPNVKYNELLDYWRGILFPERAPLKFEFPFDSGTAFNFSLSSNTMHVAIKRIGTNNYSFQFPTTFDQKLILHRGIQYAEPTLEFSSRSGIGMIQDIHPMRGLIQNRPYDFSMNNNVFEPEINLGVICPPSHKDALYQFLQRLNAIKPTGTFKQEYLLDYPNFISIYGIPLNVPDPQSELWTNSSFEPKETLIATATSLANNIKRSIDLLEATNKKLVMVIFVPTAWNNITTVDDEGEEFDLHDYIKAYAAQKQISTQFIREDTLTDNLECQVNWWLSLSFYVKAQRTPWILNNLQSETAFVGLGYSVRHRNENNKIILGCSHIYNAYGQGLKYKLSRIEDFFLDNSRRNPFLSYTEAYKLGTSIRELFFNAMGYLPKRVVLHKRTPFKTDESQGIIDSLKKTGIHQIDLVEINFEPDARFISLISKDNTLSPHWYPLSRGNCFLLDRFTALMWTHGIVPSVKGQNRNYYLGGKNIPVPIKVKKHYGSSNISILATEILGLTKMNWNNFDLYGKLPATLESSNEIARIGWLLNRFAGKTYDYRNLM